MSACETCKGAGTVPIGLDEVGEPVPCPTCRVEDAHAAEQGRWQKAIYALLLKHLPPGMETQEVDGAACDSGDPLDMTLDEVRQVIGQWEDHCAALQFALLGCRESARLGEAAFDCGCPSALSDLRKNLQEDVAAIDVLLDLEPDSEGRITG